MFFIDVFSRQISAISMKNKSKTSILLSLKEVFKQEDNYINSRKYSDLEAKLYNNLVKDYLNKNKIILHLSN